MSDKKTAVVLFNLGGPDKPESIYPFLVNFFMDKNIIRAPIFVRYFLSRYIAFSRTRNEAGSSYAALGGKSPLLENTKAQADALQKVLGEKYKVYVCMRYWHPMAPEIVNTIKQDNIEDVILVPLYPQYSTTTTRSSLQDWKKATDAAGLNLPTKLVCCYPTDEGFIKASADNIRQSYEAFTTQFGFTPRVLFSAHGLPEKIVKEGDPYQWACEESATKIAAATGLENLDWGICYQSRVGPLKWISPSTEEALKKAATDKVGVLIYPHAFVSEHVETLVEIEEEYRHVASELGIKGFARVPTVSVHPAFIGGLARLVREQAESSVGFPNEKTLRHCPKSYGQCCQEEIRF